jgi:hypothetical protein
VYATRKKASEQGITTAGDTTELVDTSAVWRYNTHINNETGARHV